MVDFCLVDEITWISIDDELPYYENIPVLFWVEKGTPDNRAGCYVGFYSKKTYDNTQGAWFDIYGHRIYATVTHWTTFPKGPSCKLLIGLNIENGNS